MSQDQAPRISIEAQYIKDLSFENPNAPGSMNAGSQPKIDMALDLQVKRIEEKKDIFEVCLNIHAKATGDKEVMFEIELQYAGIFTLFNFNEQERKAVLGVHCPALLFPYARQIISDMTQSGGFQPLMIDPIDFGALYASKMMEEEAKAAAEEDSKKKGK